MSHIAPTDQAAAALIARGMDTPVVMLNLLKFRDIADYSHAPEIAPATPISGADAYRLYEAAIMPLLAESGGSVAFSGTGGAWFIGPDHERWDKMLLVQQASVASFLAFAQNPRAQAAGLHRTAALKDSRLLPLVAD